jgi:hypothetical protein
MKRLALVLALLTSFTLVAAQGAQAKFVHGVNFAVI